MLTALPPSSKTAIEDDRPIVMGLVKIPDYYVLAHEAKSRGDHSRAATLLAMAARDLGVDVFITGDVLIDWDCHIEAVDRAWGKELVLLDEAIEPAPRRLQVLKINQRDVFADAVSLWESGRPYAGFVLMSYAAHCLELEIDWTGDVFVCWNRNFDAVYKAWLKLRSECNG